MSRTFVVSSAIVALVVCSISLAARTAAAHDPGVSAARVRIGSDAVHVTIGFDRLDALRWLGRAPTEPFDPVALRRRVVASPSDLWRVGDDDGAWLVRVAEVVVENGDDVRVELAYDRPHDGVMRLEPSMITRLARGHRQLVTVVDDGGRERLSRVSSARSGPIVFTPDSVVAASPDFSGFFVLGVEHILIGFDHLLFLFALLLAGGGLGAAVRIVTAFTVAHSITLAVAALGYFRPPGEIVEPIIALSIVAVAIENVLRRKHGFRHRWLVTFALGLVHGFGFAGVLGEIGVSESAIVPSLLGFNLGVEVGQLAVVFVTFPVVHWLHSAATRTVHSAASRPALGRVVPVLSIVVASIGAYWFVERTVF